MWYSELHLPGLEKAISRASARGDLEELTALKRLIKSYRQEWEESTWKTIIWSKLGQLLSQINSPWQQAMFSEGQRRIQAIKDLFEVSRSATTEGRYKTATRRLREAGSLLNLFNEGRYRPWFWYGLHDTDTETRMDQLSSLVQEHSILWRDNEQSERDHHKLLAQEQEFAVTTSTVAQLMTSYGAAKRGGGHSIIESALNILRAQPEDTLNLYLARQGTDWPRFLAEAEALLAQLRRQRCGRGSSTCGAK
jgi:hypothetical protein